MRAVLSLLLIFSLAEVASAGTEVSLWHSYTNQPSGQIRFAFGLRNLKRARHGCDIVVRLRRVECTFGAGEQRVGGGGPRVDMRRQIRSLGRLVGHVFRDRIAREIHREEVLAVGIFAPILGERGVRNEQQSKQCRKEIQKAHR